MIQIKRAYAPAEASDGYRVLVDRLWPRGVSKERADLDAWDKEIAPSTNLRHEFHEGDDSWAQFEVDYERELKENPAFPAFCDRIGEKLAEGPVTLVYASKNETQNNAAVLQRVLEQAIGSQHAT